MARNTGSDTSVSPVAAASFSRDARLTASPITVRSRFSSDPISPTTTVPLLMPMCRPTWAWIFRREASSRFTASIRPNIPRAARTARSGSSSWAVGWPNTAITRSPSYLRTVPSSAAIGLLMCSKEMFTASRTSSGSRPADRAVKPDRSANRMVSRRRSSVGGVMD